MKDPAENIAMLAYKERMEHAEKQKTLRTVIVCLSALLAVAIISGTVLAFKVLTEQQYALNAQYAQLYDLLSGAVITDTGEGGIIIQGGDNNDVQGGNVNG